MIHYFFQPLYTKSGWSKNRDQPLTFSLYLIHTKGFKVRSLYLSGALATDGSVQYHGFKSFAKPDERVFRLILDAKNRTPKRQVRTECRG